MSLTVNVDSYVTLQEANDYIDNYIAEVDLINSWSGLQDVQKERLLRASCLAIDSLKNIDGAKVNYSQRLQFPRRRTYGVGVQYSLYVSQYYDNGLVGTGGQGDDGLEAVKAAQITNAVYGSLVSGDALGAARKAITGLVSKKAGPISEAYTSNPVRAEAQNGIYTSKVYSILSSWVSSSVYGY